MTQEKRKFPGSTIVNAMSAALRDLRDSKNPDLSPVPDDVRIDGKTCLVTGANSGIRSSCCG